MAKIALICDVHAGVRNDSPVFQENLRKSLRWFFEYLDQHQIKYVIQGGDLVDRRKYIQFVTAKLVRDEFLVPLQERGIETHIICGNHDVTWKNTNEVNALDELIGDRYSHIKTYINPTLINVSGLDIQLLPWISDSNKESSYTAIEKSSAPILIGHLELHGFEMFKGSVSDHGDKLDIFKRFDAVYSGHYHHRSSIDNIHYIGAFGEYTWSDYNDPRGFSILDTDTRKIEFVQNPFSPFRWVDYDDVADLNLQAAIKKIDSASYENCYVKIAVKNKTNPYLFDLMVEAIQKGNPADVSILEDLDLIEDLNKDDDIDQAESTPVILQKYIAGLSLPIDNERVSDYIKDIYTEALTVEHVE